MYTKCPNCQTTFRVSTAQLKLAEGKVRCGRCDHVFNAVSHLLDDVPGRSQGVDTSMEPASTIAPDLNSLPMAEDMEQALSEVAIPGVEEGLDNVSDAAQGVQSESLDEAPISSADDLDVVDEDLFSAPAIDEVEGLALGEESFDSEPAPADGLDLDGDLSDLDMAEAPETADGLELNEDDFNLDGVDGLDKEVPEGDIDLDFNESEELLQEPSQEPGDGDELAELDEMTAINDVPGNDPVDDELAGDVNSLLDDAPHSPLSGGDSYAAGMTESVSRFESRDSGGAADDYVLRELGEKESSSWTWLSSLAWGAVILILLVVLLGQFAYFKRDQLVRYPVAKAFIEQMCGVIGPYVTCDVPEPKDVSSIQLLERDVRSHPNTKGALLISATVLSGADFTQAFPNLVLSFSDMNQQTISRRVFKPTEYLKDTAEIKKGMHPETPVRIILEIVDPGPDAVNFEFEFE